MKCSSFLERKCLHIHTSSCLILKRTYSQRSPSTSHNASELLSPNAGSSSGGKQPQTLEELLERQWEQGSQFLMEQASHFDSKPFYATIAF